MQREIRVYHLADPLVTRAARRAFEAGRFAAQTADLTNGPVIYGLLDQHQQLAESKYQDAIREGLIAGIPGDRIDRYYGFGFNYYLNVQRRSLSRRSKSL